MFSVDQPSIALNAVNVPKPFYRMWQNKTVGAKESLSGVLGWVATTAKSHNSSKIKTLVINCHGFSGSNPSGNTCPGGFGLSLGEGIFRSNVQLFSAIAGLVEEIHVIACGAAFTCIAGAVSGDGGQLCSEIAQHSGALVHASDKAQNTGFWGRVDWIPEGYIDGYEGDVYDYSPRGGHSLSKKF